MTRHLMGRPVSGNRHRWPAVPRIGPLDTSWQRPNPAISALAATQSDAKYVHIDAFPRGIYARLESPSIIAHGGAAVLRSG